MNSEAGQVDLRRWLIGSRPFIRHPGWRKEQIAAIVDEFIKLLLLFLVRISIGRNQNQSCRLSRHNFHGFARDLGKQLTQRPVKPELSIHGRAVAVSRRSVFSGKPPELQQHQQRSGESPKRVRLQQSAFLLHGRLPENPQDIVQTSRQSDFDGRSTHIQTELPSSKMRFVYHDDARQIADSLCW